jgi:hypothetical protein
VGRQLVERSQREGRSRGVVIGVNQVDRLGHEVLVI